MRIETLEQARDAAVAIALHSVDGDNGRDVGDPVHEAVTEGRRKQYEDAVAAKESWALAMRAGYSSCGDLGHYLLERLGVRWSGLNRGAAWIPGANISRLARCPWYVRSSFGLPDRGDILHVAYPEHVCVLCECSGVEWVTADYGQPYGRLHRFRPAASLLATIVRGRRLLGYVSIESLWREGAIAREVDVP